MIEPSKNTQYQDRPPDTRMMPPTFDPAYVQRRLCNEERNVGGNQATEAAAGPE
jgi:hypothetical protein